MFISKKNKHTNIRKVPFVGMTGWAVNSIAIAAEGSIPFLPTLFFVLILLIYE